MNIGEAVKERILELCRERDISINRLSSMSGVTQSTVNNIVSGRNHSTTISTIKKLCDGLGITIEDFFHSDLFRELEQEMQVTIFHRTNKGVTITAEGDEFLAYARQILDQVGLMQERYLNVNERNPRFSVSCQHYSFAVNAFVDVIRKFDARKYDFTLRETQTYEIIEDVAKLKSEIGILYTSSQNETIIMKLIRQNDLKFEELFVAKPHVFISSKHPLADKEALTLEDLEEYPYLSFEQGDYNSFYFSEEILSTLDRNKNIKVRDRATLFNLAVGLDGYTVSSGVISKELNGENIIGKPLLVDEYMRIGTIVRKDVALSRYGKVYMEALKKYTGGM